MKVKGIGGGFDRRLRVPLLRASQLGRLASFATRTSPNSFADIGCWPVMSSRSTTTLLCQFATVVYVGSSLGKRVNRVELNIPAQSARPLNLLLLAGREYGQAIPRVGPRLGESLGFSIVGDQRLPECIRIAERRKENDRPVADDAGRATGIVEADKDLAQILVSEQVVH